MSLIKKIVLSLVCLLGLLSVSKAAEPEFKPFSADISSSLSGVPNNINTHQKCYVTKDKNRFDTTEMIVIIRKDKNIMWILHPLQKTYSEISLSSDAQASMVKMIGVPVFDRTMDNFIETETIDGQLADMYKGNGLTTYCVHGSTVLLKIEKQFGGGVGFIWEFKNIQIGEPSPDVFEIPKGYKKSG